MKYKQALTKIYSLIPSIYQINPKNRTRKQILIVGMLDSPHLQKWVNELQRQKIFDHIFLFPSDSPKCKFSNKYLKSQTKIRRFHFKVGKLSNWAIFKTLDLLCGSNWRSLSLARSIRVFKPDIIHFHELQHGAYLFIPISNLKSNSCKIISSTWGSDILLYGQINSHKKRLSEVLAWTDVLTSEREEDLELAIKLGFSGDFLAPVYITVGSEKIVHGTYDLPSSRDGLIIKGYQDIPGRALNILRALDILGDYLSNFRIYIFSADKSPSVKIQAELLSSKHNLSIQILGKMDNSKLMEYYKKSRAYVGVSISDGLSTSMVEAMMHGTFPIQSLNSAAHHFIDNGINGFTVDPWDINSIVDAIKISLADDSLVDNASKINTDIINKNYSLQSGIEKMRKLYS
jgi:glycosyltransferase involved in cell wall biosynthesis